ncbi:MAG: sigma 54-interacting transcriptional regulator [Desulfobacterales bacterium]|nr:sigma 54-interacting transcriptional regulator [Desulfobacterales bacterium]
MAFQNQSIPPLDLANVDFYSVFNGMDDGVMITDGHGTILYYNQTQGKIDGISPREAMGMKVTDIYELNNRTSMIMQCINEQGVIRNTPFFYRTCSGRVVNSITSVYPLLDGDQINGTICFVKDYELFRQSAPAVHRSPCTTDRGNGTQFNFDDLVGSSPNFIQSIDIAKRASESLSPVMIQGETGTGKELVAQAIHNHSPRKGEKFVAVNCAAIPHDLLEGMLFGTCRGAFTGALDKPGLFEIAHGSTLYLDELLAMPVELQAKLLRVLQEKQVRRVGSVKEVPVDVKIISSVSDSPQDAIKDDKLRKDLYYRLGVVMVKLPALRERRDSLQELSRHFLEKYNARLGTHARAISNGVMDLFNTYHWPGNIRELEHLIEGAMNIAGQEKTIGIQHFGPGLDTLENFNYTPDTPSFFPKDSISPPPSIPEDPHGNFAQSQKQREKAAIRNALAKTRGNVTRAARILGITRQVLHYRMKKYGFRRESFLALPKGN